MKKLLFLIIWYLPPLASYSSENQNSSPTTVISTPTCEKELATDDPFLWLEEREGTRAMEWVKAQNSRSLKELMSSAQYKITHEKLVGILNDSGKIPYVRFIGNSLYNFWQDSEHVQGILRKTTLESYRTLQPHWEPVLDLDALGKETDKTLVYSKMNCLDADQSPLCILRLSEGGSDASLLREFNLETKTFVKDGFNLAASKSEFTWIDENKALLSSTLEEGSLSEAGYSRRIRLWTRGQDPSSGPIIFEVPPTHMSVHVLKNQSIRSKKTQYFILDLIDFYSRKIYRLGEDFKTLTPLPLPDQFEISYWDENVALIILKKNWTHDNKLFKQSSIVRFHLKTFACELFYEPKEKENILSITEHSEGIILHKSVRLQEELHFYKTTKDSAPYFQTVIPPGESIDFIWNRENSPLILFRKSSFLEPNSFFLLDIRNGWQPEILKTDKAHFNPSKLQVTQLFAKSNDGVEIPYYIIGPKEKTRPLSTLLYGYGGFEISLNPSYLAEWGSTWLNEGRNYVIANIRGGGEFGPSWHQAAIKENKQKSYDDFIAVAEDLIRRGFTSSSQLGIMGGSNGGLLVGAVSTQRPELFSAVICSVPLLDMIRYIYLPAGASWIGEYGDPRDPEFKKIIERYSPYQNVKSGVNYPKIFFTSSTKDDRVHPGHARKMAAKLEACGSSFFYYENIEGGHGGSANLDQEAQNLSLERAYLKRTLEP